MTATTPRDAGYRQPAEASPHEATWVAWPCAADLWGAELEPTRRAFAAMCAAIGDGERVDVLVPDDREEAAARAAIPVAGARFHRVPYGDIWLRDTAPVFVVGEGARVAAVRFGFNGWGGKWILPGDEAVAAAVAARSGVPSFAFRWVLEGGSVEADGEGTLLTTRQCLLNPNRNPAMDAPALEGALREALAAERVLWLDRGLANDHTDGHVDTVARFVRPGVVVAMEPTVADDPNRDALRRILDDLGAMRDARGRRLEIVRVPSPGRVAADVDPAPASYVNFYVSNRAVCIPTYGTRHDEAAVERIASLFPGRRAVAIDARAILCGGGAFHCITQQQPAGSRPGDAGRRAPDASGRRE